MGIVRGLIGYALIGKRARQLLKLERRYRGMEHSAERGDWQLALDCRDAARLCLRDLITSGEWTRDEILYSLQQRGHIRSMLDERYAEWLNGTLDEEAKYMANNN